MRKPNLLAVRTAFRIVVASLRVTAVQMRKVQENLKPGGLVPSGVCHLQLMLRTP